MATTQEELREKRETLANEIDALMQGDFDPKDKTLVEARSRAEALDSQIKAIVEWNAQRANSNQLDAIALRSKADNEQRQTREAGALDIGNAWVRSKAYEDYQSAPRGTSGRISLPIDCIQRRAPILTTTFADIIQPDRVDPSPYPPAPTPLLDSIRTIRVSSNVVEWVHFTGPAPLGTITAEGAAKTEAAVTPVLKSVTLDTIASWAEYSRQFGEDAPGLVDYLNSELSRGILQRREQRVATAITTDLGVIATPGTGTLLEEIRVGIGMVQSVGYQPDLVVLNPADYAALDIDVLGRTLLGPQVGQQFWGVRPVPSNNVVAGTAYIGDFRSAMVELVRSEVAVYTTDSHLGRFIENILTTLVEARTKPVVQRPEAIVKATGTP